MSLKALQEYTFISRYAKYLKNKKRRETWSEIVNRVKEMMLEKYKDIPEVYKDIEWAYELVRKKRVLGSQRAMQFGGDPILKHNMRIFNCVSSYCDRPRFFQECMYLLLAGCGTGFSVQKHHINKLPKLIKSQDGTKKFVIEDTIESWADAVGVLVSSYLDQNENFPEYVGKRVIFDYTKIRPEGSPISYGGKAPGPEPLKSALNKIRDILDNALNNKEVKLRPIQVYDIIMHSADAVLSGGVRRSATIALFSEDDEEMMNAKTGNWFVENPQRGRSNNSVVLLKKDLTKEKLDKVIEKVKQFGEPGFILADDFEHLVNPCLPEWVELITKQGKRQLKDIKIGDEIWSKEGWTTVINKWSNGIKNVKRYEFGEYILDLTEDHNVIKNGKLIKINETDSVDVFDYLPTSNLPDNNLSWHKDTSKNVLLTNSNNLGLFEVFDITVDNKSHTFWCNGCDISNCVEISFYAYNEEGKSGWEACNLSTINGAKVKTEEDFYETVKAAAIIGTLQAGFTSTGYLGEISKEIIGKEALLGVSITGIMDCPEILLNEEIQKRGAEIVVETNKHIAQIIGINPSARNTCVKPEGSASCVLGTSSGIHPHHAKRYIRRIQSNKLENVYKYFSKINPRACEDSVWSNNDSDGIISFCIEVNDTAKTKNQLSAVDLLKYVKLTQDNWVRFGKVEDRCSKAWLTHNVSNTISVKPEEWEEVSQYIFENKESFCGISLLPITGDKDYPQAPFTSIYTPLEMVKHYKDGVMFVSGLIEQALELWQDNLWAACDSLLGIGEKIKGLSKLYWKDRCIKYAEKYFENDIRKLTYAMKDVYNYKLWTELNIEYKDVDFSQLIENEDQTKISQEIACQGGFCEIK